MSVDFHAPQLASASPGWTDWGFPPPAPAVRHGWVDRDGGVTTCCERPPGQLPARDRLVHDLELVTCRPEGTPAP